MQEQSLKIVGADSTFLGKLSLTLNKILIPTKISFNAMVINIKRSSVLKAYEAYIKEENKNKEEIEQKYDKAYEIYLDTLDKYVMDTIYKKVKNETATAYEKDALIRYSQIVALKTIDPEQYKFEKQKYLLDLDFQTINSQSKEKSKENFEMFYINKVETLFKALLKNYAISIANINDISKNENIFEKLFKSLELYIKGIIPLKIAIDKKIEEQIPEYALYEKYTVGKIDQKDVYEKNLIELAIARHMFTHSLPLSVVEKCYKYLIMKTRQLLQDTKIIVKRENIYNLLLSLIEDYKIKLLANKVYWENQEIKKEYKAFLEKYKKIQKLKDENIIEYIKQKEIIFLKDELKNLDEEKVYDYTNLKQYYRRKLIDYGQIRELSNITTSYGKYTIAKKDVLWLK